MVERLTREQMAQKYPDMWLGLNISPFSELCTQWEITSKYTLETVDKDFIINI